MPRLERTATISLALAAALATLPGCASEVDDAIATGCDALREMVATYRVSGERDRFAEALIEGSNGFGIAVELASGSGPDPAPDSLIAVGSEAVRAFSVASHEAPEANGGDLVWQGEPLTREQEQAVDRGVQACEEY